MRWAQTSGRWSGAVPSAAVGIVAAVGQLSALWSPRATFDLAAYWCSLGLLFVAGALALAAFRVPHILRFPAAATYLSSVAFLMLATGGVGSGLGSLLILPVVVVALSASYAESAGTIGLVLAVLFFVSLVTPHVDAPTVRRLLLFGSINAVLSVTIHSLRTRLVLAQHQLADRITEEERRRIARELHDGLAHELALIASKTRTSRGAPIHPPASRELADAAERALDEARRAIKILSLREPQSLSQAVTQTVEDLGTRLGVPVALELDQGLEAPGQVTENLLRILREAMTNAARHGAPSVIRVRLQGAEALCMVVEDDGCGFEPDSQGTGFGLVSMSERAAAIGARFRVESEPRLGTTVEVVLA